MDRINAIAPAEQIEQEASEWLAKMDADTELSQQELADLKQWMNRSPAHRANLNDLIAFWQEANTLTELSFPLAPTTSTESPGAPSVFGVAGVWPAAGAVALVVMLAVMLNVVGLGLGTGNSIRVAANGIYETRVGEQNAIALVDGSVIELNTNSRVQVNYTPERRSIKLMQGEAYFDVSKDPDRPFEVSAGKGLVRAVGTAFAVHFNQDALTVSVTEGKVALDALPLHTGPASLSEAPSASATPVGALVAGQRGEFKPLLAQGVNSSSKTLEVGNLDKTLAWRDGLFMFEGESLATVVKEMNRYTELTIEIADPSIADIQVGGQFKVDDTQAMLDNLSTSFDLAIHRVNKNLIHLVKNKN